MILNNAESEVITIGDIKNNVVGIDSTNIGFITHILSTNLYSKPIESFLRETVSNAWDSHIEANVKDPVLLELATDSEGRDFCRIQDFGVGLSPERFNSIYRNIGSSTKRGDNTQIGGFGIGRFSALAYTDTVYITSNYNGIKYLYLMYKDGNNINIDELHTSETKDKNGLEILVYIKNKLDLRDFINAINSQLIFFENLYISVDNLQDNDRYKNTIEKFNSLKIKHYNTFTVNSIKTSGPITVCLGKVSYQLDWQIDSLKKSPFKDYPLCLKFEIGELSVTPNRESLLYDNKTTELILHRLEKVSQELGEIAVRSGNEDYDDLEEYSDNCTKDKTVALIDDVYITIPRIVKYQGKICQTLKQVYNKICTTDILATKLVNSSLEYIDCHTMGRPPQKYINFHTILRSSIYRRDFIYMAAPSYSKDLSKYLKYIEREAIIIKPLSYRNLYKICRTYLGYNYIKDNKADARIVLAYIYKKWNSFPICDNKIIPKEYSDELEHQRAIKKRARIANKEKLNIGTIRSSDKWLGNKEFQTVADYNYVELDKFISSTKRQIVIYGIKADRRLHGLHEILDGNPKFSSKYTVIETALSNLKLFKDIPNFVNIDTIMSKQFPVVSRIVTATYIDENYGDLLQVSENTLKEISKPLADIISTLKVYVKENRVNLKNNLLKELANMCKKHSYYDAYMMGYIKENEKLLNNAKFLPKLGVIRAEAIPVVIDYILARKLFIPNYITVNKFRKINK